MMMWALGVKRKQRGPYWPLNCGLRLSKKA